MQRTLMKGLLSFSILWLLKEGDMNGQQLADQLLKRRGKRPTPGTLYPALRELRERGLVNMQKRGRNTIYSLSPEGRRTVFEFAGYLCEAFHDVFAESMSRT